tara:strand:- start:4 stop:861 length:858 start_codon:yes stop_codon:yes gene_type:complete
MLKLKSLLTEAPADAIAKVADAGLAQSVSMLKKLASDPDMQGLLAKGAEDGEPKDEVVKFSTANLGCTKMFPTQAEIGFGNSLDDLVFDKYNVIDSCFKSPVKLGPPPGTPVLCAKVGGKIFILDGHHRWSSCFMTNRNAKMMCDIMEVPAGKDAEGALKIMQMAIAAKAGKVLTKDFQGQDLMATGTDEVESYVNEKMVESAIEKFNKYTNGALSDAASIAIELGVAHKVIVSMKGKFPRSIMPQADHSGAPQDTVNQALAKGTINFDEPFGEGKIKLSKLIGK